MALTREGWRSPLEIAVDTQTIGPCPRGLEIYVFLSCVIVLVIEQSVRPHFVRPHFVRGRFVRRIE